MARRLQKTAAHTASAAALCRWWMRPGCFCGSPTRAGHAHLPVSKVPLQALPTVPLPRPAAAVAAHRGPAAGEPADPLSAGWPYWDLAAGLADASCPGTLACKPLQGGELLQSMLAAPVQAASPHERGQTGPPVYVGTCNRNGHRSLFRKLFTAFATHLVKADC